MGDRVPAQGAVHALEYTTWGWSPVCPVNDQPMIAYNEDGHLMCAVCSVRYVDLPKARETPDEAT